MTDKEKADEWYAYFTYHQSDEGKGQAIMHLYNEAKKGNRPARMALDRVIEYLKK
jgi:hypothetical protein